MNLALFNGVWNFGVLGETIFIKKEMDDRMIKALVGTLICLMSVAATGTKCFSAKSMAELKNDFSVIIHGKVVEKAPSVANSNSFELKIKVEKVIYGKLDEKFLATKEVHFEGEFIETYKIGKTYTFVLEGDNRKNKYQILMPAPGCPPLPLE